MLLCLSAAPALAGGLTETTREATGAAVCPGQSFSQPFSALGDYNYYTLVPGSEFNNPPEGWELRGGAQVVSTTVPNGSGGAALDLPSGSSAVSPPVCVTLRYPSARVYVGTLEGKAATAVAVSCLETKSEARPLHDLSSFGLDRSRPALPPGLVCFSGDRAALAPPREF